MLSLTTGEYIDLDALPVQYGGQGQLPSFDCDKFLSQDRFFGESKNEKETKNENEVESENRNEVEFENENENGTENGDKNGDVAHSEKIKSCPNSSRSKNNHSKKIMEIHNRKIQESTVRKDPRIYS